MDTNLTLSEHLNHLITSESSSLSHFSKRLNVTNWMQIFHKEATGWWKQSGFKQGFMKVPDSKDGRLNVFPHGHFNGKKELKRRSWDTQLGHHRNYSREAQLVTKISLASRGCVADRGAPPILSS